MRRKGGPAARTPPARGGDDAYLGYRHRMRRPGSFDSRPVVRVLHLRPGGAKNCGEAGRRYNPWHGYPVIVQAILDLEGAKLTILHYDTDFDLIAAVTGQPCQWIVPAGSVD
jgi:hypothetical protein